MSLTKQNQELLDELYPDGYVIEKKTLPHNGQVIDEHEFYHILFIKIIAQAGQRRNRVVPMVQKFGTKDWKQAKRMIDRDIKFTQQNEYEIIHDPVKWRAAKKAAEAKVAEAKKKEETKAKAAATRKENAENK